jgi:hypothetical protein
MQGSEHGNRGDGGAGEIGRDVLRDAGKAEDVDVQNPTGLPRRFEIRAGVVLQTEAQALAGGGLLDHVGLSSWTIEGIFSPSGDCGASSPQPAAEGRPTRTVN